MPIDGYNLKATGKTLARIIRSHVMREQERLAFRILTWNIAYAYLNGARRFSFGPQLSNLQTYFLDEEGNIEFRASDLLAEANRVGARIAAMDMRPKVDRQGMSLPAIRERAVGQLIADNIVSADQLENETKSLFSHLYTWLGSAGVISHVVDHPVMGLSADLEVIHPHEMYPFPSLGTDYTKLRGYVRHRYVTLDFLRDTFGRKVMDNIAEMDVFTRQAGTSLEGVDDYSMPSFNTLTGAPADPGLGGGASAASWKPGKEDVAVVLVSELWLLGLRGLCNRYALTSGDAVIVDNNFEGQEVYCPIGWARFMENGSFHGAGLFDLLFSLARELERLLKYLFNNARDIDKFGVLALPHGILHRKPLLESVGDLKVIFYEPDPTGGETRPLAIAPAKNTDMPGRTAAFTGELLRQLSPLRDLAREKGRVDSGVGLAFLDEQINRSMENPTRGVVQAFGQTYRSMTSRAVQRLVEAPRPLPVNRLTLDLAGVVIDTASSSVSFQDNPLPNVGKLSFTIRETSPKSESARKAEALELVQRGLVADPQRFIRFALKEGIDFAMDMGREQAAHDSIVRNILLLYGDGETSQEILITPHIVIPDYQLSILEEFMGSITMAMASPEVQDNFREYRLQLLQWSGLALPEAVPNPDDTAMLTEIEQRAPQLQMAG